ncbi:hypothetical protein K1719_007961 [Acacia pycnantha]|nr:hypothetical protein K1719_007961 [Acacia pycnantha]
MRKKIFGAPLILSLLERTHKGLWFGKDGKALDFSSNSSRETSLNLINPFQEMCYVPASTPNFVISWLPVCN